MYLPLIFRRGPAQIALAAALSICTLLGTVGCNRSTNKRVAMIPQGKAHIFWQSIHAGANAARLENPGFDIIWTAPATEMDYEGEIQLVDTMINQHVDAICVSPIDRKVLVGVVEKAVAAGIPVFIFDSPIDTDKFTAQVATDNYAGGGLAAMRMGQILRGEGAVAVVAVQPGVASTLAREKGFEDKLALEFPRMKVVDKQFGMADFAKSLKVAENMLTANPGLKGMFASNESSSVGAAQAVKNRKDVMLVGFDSSPQLVEALKSGVIDSLVVQDPFQIGFKTFTAVVTKLKGGTPERIQSIPPTLVTLDNMMDPDIQKKINPDIQTYLK